MKANARYDIVGMTREEAVGVVRALRIAVDKPTARVELSQIDKANAEEVLLGLANVVFGDEDED